MPNRKILYGVDEADFKNRLKTYMKNMAAKLGQNNCGLTASDIDDDFNSNDFSIVVFQLMDNFGKIKDLQKINFDCENTEFDRFEDIGGSVVLWAWSGGDWELFPVHYVMYFDEKGHLRGYIPEDGNIYCHHCKTAYGSGCCQYCDDDPRDPKNQKRICAECNCTYDQSDDNFVENKLAMSNDVRNRLELVDSSGKVVAQIQQLPSAPAAPAPQPATFTNYLNFFANAVNGTVPPTPAAAPSQNPAPAPAPAPASTAITADQLAAALISCIVVGGTPNPEISVSNITDAISAMMSPNSLFIPKVNDILNDAGVAAAVRDVLKKYPWH